MRSLNGLGAGSQPCTRDGKGADQTDAPTIRGTEPDRGDSAADPGLPQGAPIRATQQTCDERWVPAIDIVRAMTAHVCDGNERAVTDRVMDKVCRRVGRLDCISLSRTYKTGTNITRHIKTAVVRASRLDQFIDTVAVVVHPTDPGAATLLAELYKAHIADTAPLVPGSPAVRRLAEDDPSFEEPSVARDPTSIDRTGAGGDVVSDHDDTGDAENHTSARTTQTDTARPSAPSRKRPRSCIDAASSSAHDDEVQNGGDVNADRDRRLTQRRRRAPSTLRWAAERTPTDLPLDRRPNADLVGNIDRERHEAPRPASPRTRQFVAVDMSDAALVERSRRFVQSVSPTAASGPASHHSNRNANVMDMANDNGGVACARVESEKAHSSDADRDEPDRDRHRERSGLNDDDDDDGGQQTEATFERKWNRRVASDVIARADAVGGPVRLWETRNGVCRLNLAVVASHEIAGMWEVVGGRVDPHRPAPGAKEEWVERERVIDLIAQALSSPATAVTVGTTMLPTSPDAVTIADSGLFALCQRRLARKDGMTIRARLAALVREATDTPCAKACTQLAAAMNASV